MISRTRLVPCLLILLSIVAGVAADGPGDNLADNVRRIPPPGVPVAETDRKELETGLQQLAEEIAKLQQSLKDRTLLQHVPDVQVYHKAVDYALHHDEFFNPREISIAKALITQGLARARRLEEGDIAWSNTPGLVVGGYISRIDGSVQPYGLVIPPSYRSPASQPYRLDAWFHGRGETLSELNFIDQRSRSPGEFTPPNAFVLHLYGRYCNANKFAGEIDLFEALDHVRKQYPIDANRIVVRGFSMGGAACWQFATHYAGLWAAAAPGAGFSETADFLKVFQKETLKPTWYEQRLWHWYDCTDYAVNLLQCPTVAYSGEIDSQKQAADMMAKALKSEGIELLHIIGPGTAHSYQPQAKEEINRRIDAIVAQGRNPVPYRVRFTTWTLRYNQMLWVVVDGLEQHWKRARVNAEILSDHEIRATTENVTALTLSMEPGTCPLNTTEMTTVLLDNQKLQAAPVMSDRSWISHFRKAQGRWIVVESNDDLVVRKRHGLQGPIDDAFMDSFIMVRPSGATSNERIAKWVAEEQAHAIEHWRRQFRGDARVKDDTEITEEDIARNNLILWGDPTSNKVIARVVEQLPVRWNAMNILVGKNSYSSDHHIPLLICPNPLNPKRYVVLNSGFTFREYDYLNNARQVPKLPDYAIVDIDIPVTSRSPGGIVDAGFFDERWMLPSR